MTSRPRVCIVIPTFRRTHLLPDLLDAIAHQAAASDTYSIEVVVADNDPARSAEAAVVARCKNFVFPLEYSHVAEPGLSAVRNFALEHGAARADYLAMIDDDEIPEPQWLSELLRIAVKTGADAVVGPVAAILPHDAPSWIREFRAVELPQRTDGASLSDGWSGNCLIDMQRWEALGLRFDPSLNFTGGEDQLFFRELIARGGTIAYAANALAWEDTPRARQSLRFVLLRSFRRGNTLSICDRRLRGRAGTALRALKGIGLIALSSVKILPSSLLLRRSAVVRCSCDFAAGVGMLAGLAGVSYEAYRRTATEAA